MDHSQHSNLIGYAIGGVIFLAIFAVRMRRMMQHRPYNVQNAWVLPAIFLILTGFAMTKAPPVGVEWAWVAASFAIGAALGWVRAMTIRLTVDPATRQVMAQGSPLAMVFILIIFAVRFGLRSLFMAESSALGVSIGLVDTAFLAMACGLFVARGVEMSLRAMKLLNQTPPALPAA